MEKSIEAHDAFNSIFKRGKHEQPRFSLLTVNRMVKTGVMACVMRRNERQVETNGDDREEESRRCGILFQNP